MRGRTIAPDAGEPVVGLGVSLQSATITSPVVASDRADRDGRFSLTYDTRRPRGTAVTTTGYLLTINDEPYDQRYTVYRAAIEEAGECSVDLGDVEIGPNPFLP